MGMGRGGKWSWKWFAWSAVGWITALWTAIELGSYFELEFLQTLKNYKWKGFIGVSILSLLLAPLTFFQVHIVNGLIRRRIDRMAREEQPISKNARLIHSEKAFQEHQLRLIQDATRSICATGSRSRNQSYLKAIERRLAVNEEIEYTRILFGPIRTKELEQHCLRLVSNAAISARVKVCEVCDLSKHTEAFFVSTEHETLLAISSLNSIGKFDCGLILKGQYHDKAKRLLESYSKAATAWTPSSMEASI